MIISVPETGMYKFMNLDMDLLNESLVQVDYLLIRAGDCKPGRKIEVKMNLMDHIIVSSITINLDGPFIDANCKIQLNGTFVVLPNE